IDEEAALELKPNESIQTEEAMF
ncbi:MAG: hypothetical protein JWO53_1241, partial [Chlamydiia bacterium]|nr:hypothetical protein [Chlamydiia bacterium]